jgi:hypothetical protein
MVKITINIEAKDAEFLCNFTEEKENATAVTSALREWMQAQGYEPQTKHQGRGGRRSGAGRKKIQQELALDALVKHVDEITDFGRNDPAESEWNEETEPSRNDE